MFGSNRCGGMLHSLANSVRAAARQSAVPSFDRREGFNACSSVRIVNKCGEVAAQTLSLLAAEQVRRLIAVGMTNDIAQFVAFKFETILSRGSGSRTNI